MIDIQVLKQNREFRALYLGQFISSFGSMMSAVAIPYILYRSTRSTALLGALGIIQLIPSIVGALIGGSVADSMDRKKLILLCEGGMAAITGALAIRLSIPHSVDPHPFWIFAGASAMAILNGFHRPALEAMTPRLIKREDIPAVGVLQSLRSNVAMIGGPAVAGILLSVVSPGWVLTLDFLTFLLCMLAVASLKPIPRSTQSLPLSWATIKDGFQYAMGRQELVGSYLIDIIAMTFSMPHLLFPAVSENFGSPVYLGWLHSAIPFGALLATLASKRMLHWARHGLVITRAAALWSLAMIGFGLSPRIEIALVFLALAGFADMVSAVFRTTLWNQTIPDHYRGRLAGIEMISYLSGPMLGNAQLGILSASLGVQRAISTSSLVGFLGVLACAAVLPKFINYLHHPAPPQGA